MNDIFVPGFGNKEAKILFVGEAPGAQEVIKKQPFVGASGQLLDRCMRNTGVSREASYITNVIKERPKNNDISIFIDIQKNKEHITQAARDYITFLYDEINRVNPNVVVAVGNVAMFVLTGKKGITKWRGSILEGVPEIQGRKVIPIIHPSAALRQYLYVYAIMSDLRKVNRQAESREPLDIVKRNYILDPGYTNAMEYMEHLYHSEEDTIAFDIEVKNEEVSCFSLAPSKHEAICIPLWEGGANYYSLQQETDIMRTLSVLLRCKNIIGQNISFDATFLYDKYGIVTNVTGDTMIASNLIYPDLPKGLDYLTSIWTNEPYYKDEGKKYFKFGGSDMDFWLYNAKDSVIVSEIYPELMKDIDSLNIRHIYEQHIRMIHPCMFMQSSGIRLNIEKMEHMKTKARAELGTLQERLEELGRKRTGNPLFSLNPNSPKQLKDYFYITCGYHPYRSKGRITTDDTAIKRLISKGCEEALLIKQIRHWSKLLGTYLSVSLDEDNRIRGALNVAGTKTGRLSSGKTIFGTGMNMQNQPLVMRGMMYVD